MQRHNRPYYYCKIESIEIKGKKITLDCRNYNLVNRSGQVVRIAPGKWKAFRFYGNKLTKEFNNTGLLFNESQLMYDALLWATMTKSISPDRTDAIRSQLKLL